MANHAGGNELVKIGDARIIEAEIGNDDDVGTTLSIHITDEQHEACSYVTLSGEQLQEFLGAIEPLMHD